jgi:hypothetical protein
MDISKQLPECHNCNHKTGCYEIGRCDVFVDPSKIADSDVFRPVQKDGSRLCSALSTKVITIDGVRVA